MHERLAIARSPDLIKFVPDKAQNGRTKLHQIAECCAASSPPSLTRLLHWQRPVAALQQLCAPEAREACMAMKPEERPMSLTTPMPWYAELLST